MSDIAIDVARVIEEHQCPICFGPFVKPTSLDCQMHEFCFICVAVAMQKERNCPLCRCPVTFLKEDGKIYSLTVLEPNDVWDNDDETIAGDWKLRPRTDPIVPNVRLILNPNAARLPRFLAFSWFALVVSFWASVLILIHEFIDAYCWKTFTGKIFAILLIFMSLTFTQRLIQEVRLIRTKNIVKDMALPVILAGLQCADLIFYFSGIMSECQCSWFHNIVRFSWVSLVIAVLLIENPST